MPYEAPPDSATSPEPHRGRLLTADEVAEMLQVNVSWVYDAARRNAIPHIRLGRYVRFRSEAIVEWLQAQESSPA